MSVKISPNASNLCNPEIQNLEAYLLRTFEPVRPRQEFVQGLRGKLANPTVQKTDQPTFLQSALLVGAGILGSVLVVVASVKAVLSLLHAFKVLRQSKA